MNGNNMKRNNTGYYNTQQKRGTFPAQNVRRNQNVLSIQDNMNNHIQGGYTNKQCKYMENCFNFPNCGFSHYEICRYQNRCSKGQNCRYVHLSNATFLDFYQKGMKSQQ